MRMGRGRDFQLTMKAQVKYIRQKYSPLNTVYIYIYIHVKNK